MADLTTLARKIARAPRRLFWRARRSYRTASTDLRLQLTSRSRLASGLYYGLVSPELSREAIAVAAGHKRYLLERRRKEGLNFYLLRRNIHRLEKGLVMRPRRAVFGRDFIEETVMVFSRIVAQEDEREREEIRWARDVIDEFFAVVDRSDVRIGRAHAVYELALRQNVMLPSEVRQIPYARNLDRPSEVSFDAFLDLSRRRRSVRWYEDRLVPRDLVDRALEVAVQAPSACNRQPFVFRLFDDPPEAREIAAIAMGTKGFADRLPALAVVVGQLRAYPFARDRHAIYIDASLSAMSFMFALETLGLASCPINWPDHEPYESRMRARLELEDDERVVMLIAYGWPDQTGMVPRSTKRDLSRVRSYNA